MKYYNCLLILLLVIISCSKLFSQEWENLPGPEVGAIWVRPVQGIPAQPIWGHAEGMRVGIAPMPGPRGLLRIYTPYLGHKEGKMINFIALEPIPQGTDRRGLSELEKSKLDNRQGKRFWSANDTTSFEPQQETMPAQGVISKVGGIETLTVYVFSEPFDNGAEVYVRLRFYKDKPYEVEISTYRREGTTPLKNFIVTATMGNYARLRTLYLADTIVSAKMLWPDYNGTDFAPHEKFLLKDFIQGKNNNAYFIAAPDEGHPQHAAYADNTNDHWKYYGDLATQYWYVQNPDPELEGLVNGRFVYWGGKAPIPNGISYENFELKAPFKGGAKFVYGVSPDSPEEFIEKIKK
jgi:hypothetical protein